jgi:hypothetical protein
MVLAADSRGTFGDPRGVTAQNDAMQKVCLLSARNRVLLDSPLGIGRTGNRRPHSEQAL